MQEGKIDQEKVEKQSIRDKVIGILEQVGLSTAQANLIFPQTLSFISMVEEEKLFQTIGQSDVSWLEFLNNIPTESIPNLALHKAYLAAHQHYGIPVVLEVDNDRVALDDIHDIFEMIRRSIFLFMQKERNEKYTIGIGIDGWPYTDSTRMQVADELQRFTEDPLYASVHII